MKKIFVTKYDGGKQAYDQQKVLNSIVYAGVEKDQALNILGRVEAKLYDGISTKELYQAVEKEINQQELHHHARFYRLREILAKMDPVNFEKFIRGFLEKEGYVSQWNQMVKGVCSNHQADVIAKNSKGEVFFVEVKRHRRYHRDCGLGEVVELWGRLEDIQEKNQLAGAWLITNTKFSQHAKKYAQCKKMKLTGWRYHLDLTGEVDTQGGLEKRIEALGRNEVDKIIEKACSSLGI